MKKPKKIICLVMERILHLVCAIGYFFRSEEEIVEYRSYQVPAGHSTARRVIKKSRFIAVVGRAATRESAENFIKKIRNLHPSASHNCYAFVACAPGGADIGFGDDGEVSGTAGRPMLSVLEHSGIGEIAVVVARYFGGVKLGPGGLLRAYTDCLRAALGDLELVEYTPVRVGYLVFPYAHENSIRLLFAQSGVSITGVQRGYDIRFDFTAPVNVAGELEGRIASLTSGKSEFMWK
ncbi:MAG: YigZ family protein [Candidatus Dadabacteria bacterium]|nr:YigZ family protein [Candidatus Dadabacteria bacterium]